MRVGLLNKRARCLGCGKLVRKWGGEIIVGLLSRKEEILGRMKGISDSLGYWTVL